MKRHKHTKELRKGIYYPGREVKGSKINRKFGFTMEYHRFNIKGKEDEVVFRLEEMVV